MKEVDIKVPERPILLDELSGLIGNTRATLKNFLSGKQGATLREYQMETGAWGEDLYHGPDDDCYNPTRIFEEIVESKRFLLFKNKSETILITIKKTSKEILYTVWERKVLHLAEEVIYVYNSYSPTIKIVLMDAYRGKGESGTLSLTARDGKLSEVPQNGELALSEAEKKGP